LCPTQHHIFLLSVANQKSRSHLCLTKYIYSSTLHTAYSIYSPILYASTLETCFYEIKHFWKLLLLIVENKRMLFVYLQKGIKYNWISVGEQVACTARGFVQKICESVWWYSVYSSPLSISFLWMSLLKSERSRLDSTATRY
jgi:hypothetical protein